MKLRFRIILTLFVASHLHYSLSAHTVNEASYNIEERIDSMDYTLPRESLDSIGTLNFKQGINAFGKGKIDKAEESFKIALEVRKKILARSDEKLAEAYANLGAVYDRLWQYEKALKLYDTAEYLITAIDTNHRYLVALYNNKAILYRKLKDYDRSIDFYNNAIRLLNAQQPVNYSRLSILYSNIGMLFEHMGEYNVAIERFKKSLFLASGDNIEQKIGLYESLAINYKYLSNNELAKEYYNKSFKLASSYYKDGHANLALITMNHGIYQIELNNNFNYGFSLLKKSLSIHINKFGISFPETILNIYNIGEIYKESNLDSALYYFQWAINAGYPEYTTMDISSNPDPEEVPFHPKVLTALKHKAEALHLRYLQENSLEDLKLSLNTYLVVYDIIDKMRLRYDSETSNFIISEQENETFLSGIAVALDLYEETGNSEFAKTAFSINERRTAFSLLSSIRKLEAREFGGIPPHLLVQEKRQFRQIAAYEEMIMEEKNREYSDQRKLDIWEGQLFKLNQEYEKLTRRFEFEFPDYYHLKYDASVVQADDVKGRIGNGNALVEYAISDSLMFIFTLTNSNFQITKVRIDSSFFDHIDLLIRSTAEPNFSSGVKKAYQDYIEAAYQLYLKLIQPCEQHITEKNVTIIPDGLLAYIPFEALITEPADPEQPDYRKLEYLVKRFTIGYSYSATMHFEGHTREPRPTKNLTAFAPEYKLNYSSFAPESDYLERHRDYLVPLPGVKEEVSFITRIMNGDPFIDNLATESVFKRIAGEYAILHLAMHTLIDDENPMYSKLAFTQNIDTTEDGFLNTYEIYNMTYNARMAVLSSCKTGFGKLQKGEGVMSLARGFMYAGCPSIVMTLWEVSDKTGAHLMKYFYRHLKNGMSKTDALQKSKIEFVENADQLKSHPYFWSTYVVIGDSTPIYSKMKHAYWVYIAPAVGIIGVFILVIYIRNRNRRKKGKHFRTDQLLG